MQYKRIVILFLLSTVFILTSCKSLSTQNISSSKTIYNIQLDDITNVQEYMDVHYNEMQKKYDIEKQEDSQFHIDNETPIDQLLLNTKKVDINTTCIFAHGLFDNNRNYRESLSWAETLLNDDILWARQVSVEVDSSGRNFCRLYTVRESELGGYVYIYFNYYQDDQSAVFKSSIYVPYAISFQDMSTIIKGDSIDDVIAIDRAAMIAKRNKLAGFNEDGTALSFHLLKDGIMCIQYTNDIVTDIIFDEEYIIHNLLRYCGGETAEEQWEAKNLPENRYNYSILPQDYPQG